MSKTHESKNRILKEQIVEDIKAKLDGAQSVVICAYNGLNVADVTELRALCRAQDVHYCVLKNRLVLKALQEKGIEGLDHLLEGPNAFVFGMKDAVAAPKVINDFIEKKKLTSLEIRGGLLDGKAVDVNTIKSLAALPSREVLLAKLLGSMTNAIGGFVRVDLDRRKIVAEFPAHIAYHIAAVHKARRHLVRLALGFLVLVEMPAHVVVTSFRDENSLPFRQAEPRRLRG